MPSPIDSSRVRAWLERATPAAFSTYAIFAAFCCYFAMYAFRKPFAAGTYAGFSLWGLDLKDALVISQVLGYALSKFLGIKFLSELPASRRAIALVALIVFAEVSLVAFAVLPPQLRVIALFCNGIPLGAVWGLVFGFLEGRRTSEMLGAGLSCSYIIASGVVKSAASAVMNGWGVPEAWMPAVVGVVFLPMFLGAVWLLQQLPAPAPEDEATRTKREPMYKNQRHAFFTQFLGGLLALTGLYVALTAFRDFRDSYAAEIWIELGMGDSASVFTVSEMPIAFTVMAALALLYLVKDNRRGLMLTHLMMFVGAVLIGLSTLLFDLGMVGGVVWMIGVGLGLYLCYVPYGCILFDRLIAATGALGTAVFLIYVTDAAGYGFSVALVLYKHLGHADMPKVDFLKMIAYVTAIACTLGFAYSAHYFNRITLRRPS